MNPPQVFRILRESDVRGLVTVADAVAAIEDVFRKYGQNRDLLSRPSSLSLAVDREDPVAFKIKGAQIPSRGIAGFRLVGDRQTPAGEETSDYCWICDAATARPLALIDEFWLHCLRTAVTGVVAAKYLARPDSAVVGLIGAGRIAAEALQPLAAVFPIRAIRVAARRPASARAFAERYAGSFPILPVESPGEAVAGADIVFTLSSANEPFLYADHVEDGAFLCSMGGGHELDISVLDAIDRFIVDDFGFAQVAGDVAAWIGKGQATADRIERRIDADIGQVACRDRTGRRNADDRILAVIQGMACCDLALAALALRRADERDIGQVIAL